MEHIDQLAQVEQRAKGLGLTLSSVAFRSGVYPHYVSRWRRGLTVPRVDTYSSAMKKMTAFLDQIEMERQAGASA